VRPGDALAFAVPGTDGADVAVMVVQYREKDIEKRAELIRRLQGHILEEVGVDCYIELAPLHTLPRTSSGKLSRSKARQNYIDTHPMNQGASQKEEEATTAILLQKQAS